MLNRSRSLLLSLMLPFVHGWIGLACNRPFSTAATRRLPVVSSRQEHDADASPTSQKHMPAVSPLSLTLEELSTILGGKGRAQACWDCFRLGVDPIWFYSRRNDVALDYPVKLDVLSKLPPRRKTQGLGNKVLRTLKRVFGGSIEETVAELILTSTSQDGTTKLLLRMHADGLEVETVIIPWDDRQRSTLCLSSQVGCRQACTFCATGQMGKLRSLSADEILAQVYWAQRICRLNRIFPIDNIVFMGMGEPADNSENVVRACCILVDSQLFQLASRRVTVSTVGPSPSSFETLAKAPVPLAWSVHASRDEVRKALVPTTNHTMEELRDALIDTVRQRPRRLRTTMLELTLLDHVNDTPEDAMHLVNFIQPLYDVENMKLVVNLIPWNDIGSTVGAAAQYRPPTTERVLAFQRVLTKHGVLCYIRKRRGDDESAACGQLATQKKQRSKPKAQ